jgi:hypothetical protein
LPTLAHAPEADKSWTDACQHFQQYATDRDEVQTAGGAGFHANHVEIALAANADALASLHDQMANLGVANTNQAATILDLTTRLAASTANHCAYRDGVNRSGHIPRSGNNRASSNNNRGGGSDRRNQRSGATSGIRSPMYCWTHGSCAHHSSDCENRDVESLEEEAATGNLDNSEVFMFTNNSTVYKGSSSSPKLLSLIVRLRALGTKHGKKIHIFHIAGTRMIAQGTDEVSRGYLALGIMAGEAMCSFIPIHQTASEHSPKLVEWIKDWSGSDSIVLDPIGWFEKGHDIVGWNKGIDGFKRPIISSGNTYLWFPPPFAAEFALAEMRKARIKRQTATHIFVCPRL